MADTDQERTEQPTGKRLQQAREKGQIARSKELGTASVLLAAVFGLLMVKESLAGAMVKVLTMGLVTLKPVIPVGISPLFYLHLCFLSVLLIYFPFSKLMHMGGVFLSPTRNLPNNSRAVHHDNPWNPPKKFRTYAEYEDDFREVMAEAGLPLEKEPDEAAS